MVEFWVASIHLPGSGAAVGWKAEAEGFDGISLGDTQNLAADPFAGLSLAATATERLGLMVGVTNPVTRLPAVVATAIATAIATVQVESGGGAILGLGRGDSSLGHVGRVAATVDVTARFAEQVQAYLRSDVVDIDGYPSEIPWIAWTGQPKVALDVAASGPRMLALGARCAERLTVNMGALTERVAWAIDMARQVHGESAPGAPLSLGASLVIAAHPEPRLARQFFNRGIEDVHQGAYAIPHRLEMMEEQGIWAEIVCPNTVGFGGQNFRHVADPARRRLAIEIYHDAMAEIQKKSGGRLLPMGVLPFWDIELAVAEIERMRQLDLHGLNTTSAPHDHGLPDLGTAHWDPVWEIASDHVHVPRWAEVCRSSPRPHRRRRGPRMHHGRQRGQVVWDHHARCAMVDTAHR